MKKQTGIHIFQKDHLDSRQMCGEEVLLGQMPELKLTWEKTWGGVGLPGLGELSVGEQRLMGRRT